MVAVVSQILFGAKYHTSLVFENVRPRCHQTNIYLSKAVDTPHLHAPVISEQLFKDSESQGS
jgi:hypothetical protein